jgi:hypothetical protein
MGPTYSINRFHKGVVHRRVGHVRGPRCARDCEAYATDGSVLWIRMENLPVMARMGVGGADIVLQGLRFA